MSDRDGGRQGVTSRRGFTLMQLLLVIAGVGIALGIAVPILRAWGRMSMVSTAAFSPDGRMVALGYDNGIVALADPGSGRILAQKMVHMNGVSAVAFTPDGRTIATGSEDGSISLWDGRLRLLRRVPGPLRRVDGIAFSPSGTMMADGGADGTVRLWEMPTGKLLHSLRHGVGVGSVAFSPDGKVLASVGRFGEGVKFWDSATGNSLAPYQGAAASAPCIAYAPDGTSLAAGGSGTVAIWDLAAGRPKLTLKGDANTFVNSLVYSPDGSLLAAGEWYYMRAAADRVRFRLRLWELPSGRELLAAESATFEPAAFSPDGKRLWCWSSFGRETLRVWDVGSGRARDVWLGDPRSTEPIVLALACWLWALAWAKVAPDGTERLQKLRDKLTPQDYRARVPLSARPKFTLFGALAWAFVTVGFVLAMMWIVPALPSVFVDPPGSLARVLSLYSGRPLTAALVGVAAGCAFALPTLILLRRNRALVAEAAILRTKQRRRVAPIFAPLLLVYAAGAAVVLLAWSFGVSVYIAGTSSWVAVALLYWEQAAVCRAAEERLAEVRHLQSEKLKYFQV